MSNTPSESARRERGAMSLLVLGAGAAAGAACSGPSARAFLSTTMPRSMDSSKLSSSAGVDAASHMATGVVGEAPVAASWPVALTAVGPVALVASAALRLRRRAQGSGTTCGSKRAVVLAAVQGDRVLDVAYADQDLAAEIAALELEAAQLRSNVAELETEQVEQRLLEQRKWFKTFDLDGSGVLDATELWQGMNQYSGLVVQKKAASELLRIFDKNGNGTLEESEFDLPAFQAALEKMWAVDRAKEDAARAEERLRQEQLEQQLEADRQLEEYRSLPGQNQDTGFLTGLGCALAYILPLTDGVRFGLPLAFLVPALQPLFALLLVPDGLLNAIPFGRLLLFVAMQFLSGDEKLPALLRYNLRQAIILDIALFVPNILVGIAGLVTQGQIPDAAVAVFGALVFLPLAACIAYSVGSSIRGDAPRGIPGISEAAARDMGMVPPERKSSENDDDLPA